MRLFLLHGSFGMMLGRASQPHCCKGAQTNATHNDQRNILAHRHTAPLCRLVLLELNKAEASFFESAHQSDDSGCQRKDLEHVAGSQLVSCKAQDSGAYWLPVGAHQDTRVLVKLEDAAVTP